MRARFVHAAALAAFAALALAGCGRKDDPAATQSAAERQAEKDAATKRTRENAVFGDQLKSLDKAKGVQDTLNKAAEERSKAAEDQNK